MKYLLVSICLLLRLSTKAQLLYPYQDKLKNFSIAIPENWLYWNNSDSLKVSLVVRNKEMVNNKPVSDNFNVNIIPHSVLNVDSAFFLLANFTAQNRLAMLDTGHYIVDGKKILWFEDVHVNKSTSDTLCAADFVMYGNNKVYVLTCTTTAERFKQSRDLFHKVAQTFKTDLPAPHEVFNLDFPTDIKWQKTEETQDTIMSTYQVLPINENTAHWTQLIQFTRMFNASKASISATVNALKSNAKTEFKNPVIKVLFVESDKALIEMENPAEQMSILYYLVAAKTDMHMITYIAHKPQFLDTDINRWTAILKAGKVVIE